MRLLEACSNHFQPPFRADRNLCGLAANLVVMIDSLPTELFHEPPLGCHPITIFIHVNVCDDVIRIPRTALRLFWFGSRVGFAGGGRGLIRG